MGDSGGGIPGHAPFVQRDLFGGRGDVHVWDLLRGAPAPPFSAVLRCRLAPGGRVGRHVQQHHPEVVLVLAGAGEARVDGNAVALVSGVVVHLPLAAS